MNLRQFSFGIITVSFVLTIVFGYERCLDWRIDDILNISSVLIPQPNWEILLVTYGLGLPFDLIHAEATAFFFFSMNRKIFVNI